MKQYFTSAVVDKIKTRVVNSIPHAPVRLGTGIYERFWKDLNALPTGKYLAIPAKSTRLQRALGAFLYVKGIHAKKRVGITIKKGVMYVHFRTETKRN